jgi:PIN domain nuclease of toxin-antitoxin system
MTEVPTLLLDTHVWIWWAEQDNRLPHALRDLIQDYAGAVAVSAASVYELAILAQRKRLTLNRETDDWIERATDGAGIEVLPIDAAIAQQAGNLPLHHCDPLDRLIIATAFRRQAKLASVDSQFPSYDVLKGLLITGKE